MPQPKKFATSNEQKAAWDKENTERFEIKINKKANINKSVLQLAAKAGNVSMAQLLMEGANLWIETNLPAGWLDEYGNKSD